MIGDLYERKLLVDIDSAFWIIEGFVEAYGGLSDGLAFRTAIHTGVHLLNWYIRRAPGGPLKGTAEQQVALVKTGLQYILKGWEKDRGWFAGSALAGLFRT
jgi:hypothetical protein